MLKGIIREGDITSHGGIVITATSTIVIDGKRAALVGDLVSCPKKNHGINPIVSGASDWFSEGKPVAVEGSVTACGCVLIVSLSHVSAAL